MPVNMDPDIREYVDMMIGCLREMQKELWDKPIDEQQEAIKQTPELDIMEKIIKVFRTGNYTEDRQNRSDSEAKYLT